MLTDKHLLMKGYKFVGKYKVEVKKPNIGVKSRTTQAAGSGKISPAEGNEKPPNEDN